MVEHFNYGIFRVYHPEKNHGVNANGNVIFGNDFL